MFKKSKYIILTNTAYRVLIHNNKNGLTLEFPKELLPTIEHVLNNPDSSQHERLFDELYSKGFIVPDSTNEQRMVYDDFMSRRDETLNVMIFVTDSCNFRCIYCGQDHIVRELSGENQRKVISLIDLLTDRVKTQLQVLWFGGEPLLCKKIIYNLSAAFMEICHKKHIAYLAGITTNGYLLDFQTFNDLFYKCHVSTFQITIDGGYRVHNAQRFSEAFPDTYSVIINNLSEIKHSNKSRGWRIMIRSNLTAIMTDDDIPDYLNMVELFADDKRFVFTIRRAWGIPEELLCSESMVSHVIRSIREKGVSVDYGLSDFTAGGLVCGSALPNSLYIYCDGTIRNCDCIECWDTDNIVAKGIDESFLTNVAYQGWKKIPFEESCEDCVYYPCCLGYSCCRAYRRHGSYKGEKCQDFPNDLFSLAITAYSNNSKK